MLLTSVWGLEPARANSEAHRVALGALEDTFVDDVDAPMIVVNLVVTEAHRQGDRWTAAHSRALHSSLSGMDTATLRICAVVIVDGDIGHDALELNGTPDGDQPDMAVHVIESTVVSTIDFGLLPVIVESNSVRETEELTSVTELPRVRVSAPEVQATRARVGDVLAYPPTTSGQVFDWTARIVVRGADDDAIVPDDDAETASGRESASDVEDEDDEDESSSSSDSESSSES